MANSLSDQLLKAGLITQEQIDKADQDKKQQKERAKLKKQAGKQAQNNRTGQAKRPRNNKDKSQAAPTAAPGGGQTKQKAKKEPSDLEQFYRQRNELERQEREAEEKKKREAAARRKQTRKQIRELIAANMQNTDDASVRFNFVVGETVKYLYVTEEQQKAIGRGELAITFMDGKRCLVSVDIGDQILALDPDKVVISYKDVGEDEFDLLLAEVDLLEKEQTAAANAKAAEKLAAEERAAKSEEANQAEQIEATPKQNIA